MAGALKGFVRTYPVTFWLTVGVFSYAWKASLVATQYQNQYQKFHEQRVKELQDLKMNDAT
jgi:hypothetical protein